MRNLKQELRRSRRALPSSPPGDVKAQEHMLRWTYARAGPRRWNLLAAAFPADERRQAASRDSTLPVHLRSPPPLPKLLTPYLRPLKVKEMKTPPRESPKEPSRSRIKNQEWKERARIMRKIELPVDLLSAQSGNDAGQSPAEEKWRNLGGKLAGSLKRMSAPSPADEACARPRRLKRDSLLHGQPQHQSVDRVPRRWRRLFARLVQQSGLLT